MDIFTYFTVLKLLMIRFKNIIFLTAVLGLLPALTVQAQQDPQFSLNMFNQLAVNPGFAGSQGMLSASVLNRQQWMGFEGNPKTTLASVHMPVKPFGFNSGVGVIFMDDQLGFEKNIAINLNYAYRLELGNGQLGIGLAVGLLNKAIDGKWTIPDSDNHIPASQDPAIPDQAESAMVFDMGMGLFYHTDDFYAGLSSTHLFQPTVDYGMSAKEDVKRHYYASAGYNFNLPNPLFELQPSLFAKYDGASVQIDINTNVIYNKKIWGGVSYRLGDAVILLGGLELSNGLRLGVAYDFTTSALAHYSHGSVEFMLNYSLEIGMDKFNRRYRSVRFL
ncbi:MAG: type IX secretion system membrane protein PorP/SprF [Bacteroidales bacterium]|nr:type IX secretion system membrane protein PorP/SprF [Bacteroidales bacterium]